MPKSPFLNQKLGKRMSRKLGMLKAVLLSRREKPPATASRLPKKGISREKPHAA